jgi:integrase
MTKAANGRSSIHRRAGSAGWVGWVSFGADPSTGKRRRKKVTGQTKTEVAAKVAKLEADRDGGYAGLAGRTTVAEWLDLWIATKVGSVRPKTIVGYGVDRAHIVRAFGAVELTKLTPEHIEQLYAQILASGCGPATTTHVRATLSAALNQATRRGRIARNPVPAATSPRQVLARVEPLSVAETRRVLDAATGGRNAARWALALLVGPRQGEVLGLRWEDVDLDAGTIHIRRSLARAPWKHGCGSVPCGGKRGADCPARFGGGLVAGPVKTAAGERVIALPAGLTAMLRATAPPRRPSGCAPAASGATVGMSSPTGGVVPWTHGGTGARGKSCWRWPGCGTPGCMTPAIPAPPSSSSTAPTRWWSWPGTDGRAA